MGAANGGPGEVFEGVNEGAGGKIPELKAPLFAGHHHLIQIGLRVSHAGWGEAGRKPHRHLSKEMTIILMRFVYTLGKGQVVAIALTAGTF